MLYIAQIIQEHQTALVLHIADPHIQIKQPILMSRIQTSQQTHRRLIPLEQLIPTHEVKIGHYSYITK